MSSLPELESAGNMSSAEFIVQRVKHALRDLGNQDINALQCLYTDDVYFEDPSHGIQGRSALLDYFKFLLRNQRRCTFRFHRTLTDGTDIFLSWTLFLNHRSLDSGRTVRIEGASYMKTRNGRIYYQRDYIDPGAKVYEHLPLLRRIVRRIKQRIAG